MIILFGFRITVLVFLVKSIEQFRLNSSSERLPSCFSFLDRSLWITHVLLQALFAQWVCLSHSHLMMTTLQERVNNKVENLSLFFAFSKETFIWLQSYSFFIFFLWIQGRLCDAATVDAIETNTHKFVSHKSKGPLLSNRRRRRRRRSNWSRRKIWLSKHCQEGIILGKQALMIYDGQIFYRISSKKFKVVLTFCWSCTRKEVANRNGLDFSLPRRSLFTCANAERNKSRSRVLSAWACHSV